MSFAGVWEAVQNGWGELLEATSSQTKGALNGHDTSVFFIIFILLSYSPEELLQPGGGLKNI